MCYMLSSCDSEQETCQLPSDANRRVAFSETKNCLILISLTYLSLA